MNRFLTEEQAARLEGWARSFDELVRGASGALIRVYGVVAAACFFYSVYCSLLDLWREMLLAMLAMAVVFLCISRRCQDGR